MIFLEMFVAFAATMAFAVIFNVSRSELIFCGIAGLVAEGVYLFTLRISDETALAIFVASIAVTVLSRILANVRRMPVTVYLISGIISAMPLIHVSSFWQEAIRGLIILLSIIANSLIQRNVEMKALRRRNI